MQLFVSLPVADLERAKRFYEAIGGRVNPSFTDERSACIVLEDGHSYVMVLQREFFQTMTDLQIGDPAVNPTAGLSVFVDSREAVDTAVEAGVAAGGRELADPQDYGFMYQRGLADPDGNVVDFGWMEPRAAEIGPAAWAAEQGQQTPSH